jgi:hypothetical protein
VLGTDLWSTAVEISRSAAPSSTSVVLAPADTSLRRFVGRRAARGEDQGPCCSPLRRAAALSSPSSSAATGRVSVVGPVARG